MSFVEHEAKAVQSWLMLCQRHLGVVPLLTAVLDPLVWSNEQCMLLRAKVALLEPRTRHGSEHFVLAPSWCYTVQHAQPYIDYRRTTGSSAETASCTQLGLLGPDPVRFGTAEEDEGYFAKLGQFK